MYVVVPFSFPELKKLEADKLIIWDENGLELTELGNHFVRNICRAFDLHLLGSKTEEHKSVYSKAI